jgi:5-hydroxyisourate hydrolase-like protein (transthyretin family)
MKILTITVLVCTAFLLLQTTASKAIGSISISEKGQICGRIVDSISGNPLESVSVDLYTSKGEKLVVGTLTNNKGVFTLTMIEPGDYILDISIDGYYSYRAYNVNVKTEVAKNEVGEVKLTKKIGKTERTTSRNKQVVKEADIALKQ